MAKIKFFNKEMIAQFIGECLDVGAKGLDTFDLFQYDGLLSALPFGKILSYIGKKAIKIKDKDEAFKKAFSLAYFSTFANCLKRYNIDLQCEKENFRKYLMKEIKADYKAEDFDLENFYSNKILDFYKDRYKDFLKQCGVEDGNITKIYNYLQDYLELNFYDVIEKFPVTYEKYTKFLKSKSYEISRDINRKTRYDNDLKNEYTAPLCNDDTGMSMADIYVGPKFRIHESCIFDANAEDQWQSSQNGFMEHIKYNESIHQFVYDILRNNNPITGLRHPKANVMFILGFPGQGKSSFCKKTIYDIVAGETVIDRPFYFLRFKDIQDVQGFVDNPLKVIKDKIEDDLDLHSPLDKSKFNSALLILDGLDELYMRKNMDINLFDEVCKVIIRFTKQKVVITSRYGCLDIEGFKHEEVLILQLKEFELEQKIRWLNKFQKFHEDIFLTVELLKKYNDREKFEYINELTKQPLLLHMLTTSNFRIEDTSNRARIYDKLFDSLIDRKYEKSRHLNLKNLEKEDIEKFIMDIALSIFHTGNEYISKIDFLKHESTGELTDKFGEKKFKDSTKGIFMALYFREVHPEDSSNYTVEFLHKSLFRYMVAKKIWEEMKVFLHYNQTSKDYSINNYEDALNHICNLFSKQLLPLEIVNYLIEIIKNDKEADKEKLAERMSSFFSQLIEKDFINQSAEEKSKPINPSLNTFYGYWTILSHLCVDKNHITRDIKDKFVIMVKSLLSLYEKRIKMDLSHQWLNGVDLREAFLCGINFSEVHLCGADIRRASLNGSILHKAVLSGANLSEAYFLDNAVLSETNFNGAVLTDAVLSGANLRDSILRGVDFSRAVLSNANFNASDLSGANLTGAVLSETDFREAILLGTDLSETDLSETYLDNANLQGAILDKENYQLAKEAGAIVSETNE